MEMVIVTKIGDDCVKKEVLSMDSKINYYDTMRMEFFQFLLPRMIYQEAGEERDQFYNLLLTDGDNLLKIMLNDICEQDNQDYPYAEDDFKFETLERGGVSLLEIGLPPSNPNVNDLLRCYVLFMKRDNNISMVKYFAIMRFVKEKAIFILHINENGERFLGDELTGHPDDKEYEYWRLVADYAITVNTDIKKEERNRDHRRGQKTRVWSKDWEHFDWSLVRTKLDGVDLAENKADCNVGISKEEFLEYFEWLNANHKGDFLKMILYLKLKDGGFDEDQIERLAAQPEILIEMIKMFQRES